MSLRRLPTNIPPRGLTADQAAEYVGLTKALFDGFVRQGIYPAPLPGGSYDKAALDMVLDRLSGLAKPSLVDDEAEALRRIPRGHQAQIRHATAK